MYIHITPREGSHCKGDYNNKLGTSHLTHHSVVALTMGRLGSVQTPESNLGDEKSRGSDILGQYHRRDCNIPKEVSHIPYMVI